MANTDINSEDRLVQATFADHLENQLGRESVSEHRDDADISDMLKALRCGRRCWLEPLL